MDFPPIQVKDGYTIADVVVGLRHGLAGRPSTQICEACMKRDEEVFIQRKDAPDMKADAKSVTNLMMLGAAEGDELAVHVQGTGESARTLALRICSALMSPTFDLDWDMFHPKRLPDDERDNIYCPREECGGRMSRLDPDNRPTLYRCARPGCGTLMEQTLFHREYRGWLTRDEYQACFSPLESLSAWKPRPRVALIDPVVKFSEVLGPETGDLMRRNRLEVNEKIMANVRAIASVTTYVTLDGTTIDILAKDCGESGPYEVILTHAPFDEGHFQMTGHPDYIYRMQRRTGKKHPPELRRFKYDGSVRLLAELHEKFPETMIVAVTGADPDHLSDERLAEAGVSRTIRRRDHGSDFYEAITKAVRKATG